MDQNEILKQLEINMNGNSSIETLMQIDETLDKLNVYAYKNWLSGEIVDGPHIERYWVTVTLMYDYKKMPDPSAAERIQDAGGHVYYTKEDFISAAKLVTPDDVDPEGDERRPGQPSAKKVSKPVWLLTLEIPRSYMDTITSFNQEVSDIDVDVDDAEQAFDMGLGDEDAIEQD